MPNPTDPIQADGRTVFHYLPLDDTGFDSSPFLANLSAVTAGFPILSRENSSHLAVLVAHALSSSADDYDGRSGPDGAPGPGPGRHGGLHRVTGHHRHTGPSGRCGDSAPDRCPGRNARPRRDRPSRSDGRGHPRPRSVDDRRPAEGPAVSYPMPRPYVSLETRIEPETECCGSPQGRSVDPARYLARKITVRIWLDNRETSVSYEGLWLTKKPGGNPRGAVRGFQSDDPALQPWADWAKVVAAAFPNFPPPGVKVPPPAGLVELACPNCGEPQMLPEDERDGESDWSLNNCDQCNEAGEQ